MSAEQPSKLERSNWSSLIELFERLKVVVFNLKAVFKVSVSLVELDQSDRQPDR